MYDDCIISRKRVHLIGRKNLKSKFKMAVGKKFNNLKKALADYLVFSKSIGRRNVEM